MEIVKRKLCWINRCCGCKSTIPRWGMTYILSDVAGVNGTIHLCEKCIADLPGYMKVYIVSGDEMPVRKLVDISSEEKTGCYSELYLSTIEC